MPNHYDQILDLAPTQHLGFNTPLGQSEWAEFLRRREEMLDGILKRREAAATARTAAPTLSNEDLMRLVNQNFGPITTDTNHSPPPDQWEDPGRERARLIGSARAYGIEDAETIPSEVLYQLVEDHRNRVRGESEVDELSWRGARQRLESTVGAGLGINFLDNTNRLMANVTNLVPFLKDATWRRKGIRHAEEWLSRWEENLSHGRRGEGGDTAYEMQALTGQLGAYVAPSVGLFRMFGSILGVGGHQARTTLAAKYALEGAASTAVLEAGAEDLSLQEKLMIIGAGGVLGGAIGAGGAYAGATLGGIGGAGGAYLSGIREPERLAGAGIAGAAAGGLAGATLRRLNQSFRTSDHVRSSFDDIPEADWRWADEIPLAGGAPQQRALPGRGGPLDTPTYQGFPEPPTPGQPGQPRIPRESSFFGDTQGVVIDPPGVVGTGRRSLEPIRGNQVLGGPQPRPLPPAGSPQSLARPAAPGLLPPGPQGPAAAPVTGQDIFQNRPIWTWDEEGVPSMIQKLTENDVPFNVARGPEGSYRFEFPSMEAEDMAARALGLMDEPRAVAPAVTPTAPAGGPSSGTVAPVPTGGVQGFPSPISRPQADPSAQVARLRGMIEEDQRLLDLGIGDPAVHRENIRRAESHIRAFEGHAADVNSGMAPTTLIGVIRQAQSDAGINPVVQRMTRESKVAEGDALTITKQSQALDSPATPDLAIQPRVVDADVARAAMEANPGQISVVRGVDIDGAAMRRYLQRNVPGGVGPQDFRLVKHGDRTDIILGAGRGISNKQAKQYKEFGMFQGLRAQTAAGAEVEILNPGSAKTLVRSVNGGNPYEIPTRQLIPGTSTAIASDRGASFGDFKKYALEEIRRESQAAGIPELEWLSPEAMSQVPRLIDEFLTSRGVVSEIEQSAYLNMYDQKILQEYRNLAPVEWGQAREIADAVGRAVSRGEGSIFSRPKDLAHAQGFDWVEGPGFQVVLRDRSSDLVTTYETPEAAEAFIRNLNRSRVEDTGGSDVPIETMDIIPGGVMVDRTIETPWRASEPEMIFSIRQVVGDAKRETERMRRMIERDFPELGPGMAGDAIGMGGIGGGRIPPSDVPLGPNVPPGQPRQLLGEEQSLGAQFERLKKELGETKFAKEMTEFEGFVLDWFLPTRHAVMKMETGLRDLGITEGRMYLDYDRVARGVYHAWNEVRPFLDRWRAISNKFTQHEKLTNGTFRKIAEITEGEPQMAAMMHAGYTNKDIEAQLEYRELMEDIRKQFNIQSSILDYAPRMRAMAERGEDPSGVLPEELQFLGDYMRTGSLNVLEENMNLLMASYMRSLGFNRHVNEPWQQMKARWVDDRRIPDQLRDYTNEWLHMVWNGAPINGDKVLRGTENALRALGIPVTQRDISAAINFANNLMYRGWLGGKPSLLARELITPYLTGTRIGFGPINKSISRFLSNDDMRTFMVENADRAGAIQWSAPKTPGGESFIEDPRLLAEATDLTARESGIRKAIGRVYSTGRDMMPENFRSGIGGTWADPLKPYTYVSNEWSRLITFDAGWSQATAALRRYSDGEITMEQLVREAKAHTFEEPITHRFRELVARGEHDEAADLIGREAANDQNRYNSTETSRVMRNMGQGRKGIMAFGTFAQQYGGRGYGILKNRNLSLADKSAILGREASVAGALTLASFATKWNFMKWIWAGSLTFGGGPASIGILERQQALLGQMNEAQGNYVPPMQAAAKGQYNTVGDWIPTGWMNPYAGLMQTVGEVLEGVQGATPIESTGQVLMTGGRANTAPAMQRAVEGWESRPPPEDWAEQFMRQSGQPGGGPQQ